jgi:RimJ/RimL family protein N-acetyltransferase
MEECNLQKVYLRAFEKNDEDFLIALRSTKDLFRYTGGNTYFASSEHSKKLLQDNIINNQEQLYLLICLCENNLPIGYLSIINIDHLNKKTQWGGIIIDPKVSGNGYATLAAQKMIKYVFEELNMNRIYGYWLEDNLASLRMAEKLGFQVEGILREHVFKENKYQNLYVCSLLKKDYSKNNGNW